jgi:hypothetical protein
MDKEPVSSLPEKFEDFESRMKEEKPKRRRSTPAVKPKGMPAPKKKLTAEDVPGVGGMVEKRWSGIPMWECPKCLGTTFKAVEAKIHQCKQVKYADEETD